jgi:hypothetical protein
MFTEYDALVRLGIMDHQVFVRKHFPNEKLLLLPAFAVGPQIIDQVEAAVEEAIATGSMVDIMVSVIVKYLFIVCDRYMAFPPFCNVKVISTHI